MEEDKKSKKSKETAIKELNEIIQKYDIKNKYYCLSYFNKIIFDRYEK